MIAAWEILVFVLGSYVVAGVTGALWSSHKWVRIAPMVWGMAFGLFVAHRWQHSGLQVLEDLAVGLGLGAVLLAHGWNENRRDAVKP